MNDGIYKQTNRDYYYIYRRYISIDTVFRPIGTHQYGSIHQILILQLVGLEP